MSKQTSKPRLAEPPELAENESCGLATQFRPRQTRWLWEKVIPGGGLTMVDGLTGIGKSTVLADLAARVTRGALMPDGTAGVKGGVLIMSSEEDIEEDILPRLVAFGADLKRIGFPGQAGPGSPFRPPLLPYGVDKIGIMAAALDARLLIMDPWISFLASGFSKGDEQDCRAALEPLHLLSKQMKFAPLLIRHPTKNESQDPINRGGGSVAISALARTVLWFDRDPRDPRKAVMSRIKGNKGKKKYLLSYELMEDVIKLGRQKFEIVRVNWLGPGEDSRSEQNRREEEQVKEEEYGEAENFLRLELASAWIRAEELINQARKSGISETTLRRTKARLKVDQRWNTDGKPRFSEWGPPKHGWAP